MPALTCPQCQGVFPVPPSQATRRRYCSAGCQQIATRARIAAERDRYQATLPVGTERDFDALYTRYNRRVYGFLRLMLGNAEDAADLTQETFIRAWATWDRFEVGPARSWLLTIARNTAYTHIQQRKRAGVVAYDPETRQAVPHTPEHSYLETETRQEVRAALDTLRPCHAAVLLLNAEGYTCTEIAAHYNINRDTVKTWLQRGRAECRAALRIRGALPAA